MTNGDYYLTVDGSQIRLRRNDNILLVTPARDKHPASVAARLARSSRLALDPTYPPEFLVFRGENQKLKEVATYPDIQNTRSAFQDPQGNLLVLTNDILISFVEGSSDEDRERLLAKFDGRITERKAEVWKFRVNDPGADASLLLANELSNESIVNYAEPNALQAATFLQFPQNEPRFGNQWHLQNTGQNGGTAGADVDALGAWAITTGSPNVAIVVHDSGVDINHPDLVANIDPGWDFDNSDNDATNNNGPHGTACAGVIAAAVNGQGVTGIAPGCRIIPLRAANALTWQNWADTFDWAAQRGQIISCSWSITPNNTLSAAIRRAVRNGTTVFCATGNDAQMPSVTGIDYPASMNETIAVGASTNLDRRAGYSQFGSGIDVVAPSNGGTLGIETTDVQGTNGYNAVNSPGGDYCNANDPTGFGGTSSATPLTAGIAGLMLSVNPSLTPAEIRVILRETADKIDQSNANYDGNGWSAQCGSGRVNAAAAVQRALSRLIAVVAWGPNHLDIFGLGTDRAMFHKAGDGSVWHPSPTDWEQLGGVFTSPPAVAAWSTNRLDIFALGLDWAMYHKAWDGSAWYPSPIGWERLGGVFMSPPAVASWGPNRLDIFGLGTDRAMFHKAWDGSAWYPSPTGWERLGGDFMSPPAVAAWGPNRLDIFGLGTDRAMFHKAWDGSAWYPSPTGWERLGGDFMSPPAVAAWGPNRLDIFGLGTDRAMFHKAWDGSAWYPSPTDWERLGGDFMSPPAVAAWGPNRLDIFGLGTDRAMFHKAWDGSAWYPSPTDWERLGGDFMSPPAVAAWGPNRLDIFGLGTDRAIYHKGWDGSAWYPSPIDWDRLGEVFS